MSCAKRHDLTFSPHIVHSADIGSNYLLSVFLLRRTEREHALYSSGFELALPPLFSPSMQKGVMRRESSHNTFVIVHSL